MEESINSNSFFSGNIKLLRKRRGRTQDDVAFALNIPRSTLSGYENQVAQPTITALIAFSNYYKVAIDTLVKVDLTNLSESQMGQLERGYDVFISGSKLRVLSCTVDSNNNENIEVVNVKAKAGYANGYADPEYIKVLPTFQLPFLSREKKYRTFQISGDSMLPIPDGSWVTGEFIQNWNLIKTGHPAIVLTLDEGVVFKIVENNIKTEGKIKLHSLNPLYDSYDVEVGQIRELWKFVNFISSQIPEGNNPKDELINEIKQLRKEVRVIQTKLSL